VTAGTSPREEGFTSTEPLLEDDPYAAVNDPWVLSAYTYASSNPLRYVDPDGRASKTAYNSYDLGEKLEKHEAGHITISVAKREDRKEPAFSVGGRYSNDLNGQDLQKSFQDHKDKAVRILDGAHDQDRGWGPHGVRVRQQDRRDQRRRPGDPEPESDELRCVGHRAVHVAATATVLADAAHGDRLVAGSDDDVRAGWIERQSVRVGRLRRRAAATTGKWQRRTGRQQRRALHAVAAAEASERRLRGRRRW
jgi:hypothetical protein